MYLAFEDEEEPRAHARVGTQCRAEIQEAMEAACAVHEHGGGRHGKSKQVAADDCAEERYERDALPPGTDAAFARFSRVVSRNPEQVLRYQFGGVPLLYTAQDETARLLRAGPQSGDSGSDSDSDSDAGGGGWRRGCSTDGLPKCPRCGARRVFECQIMPALLSVLQLSSHAQQTAGREADLRAAAAQGLAGGRLLQSFDLGMEFGAALVFVCEADCHREQPSGRPGATYYDELVLVQQESL
ncbi:hypothetical protein H4R21_003862 [Coemansia helicoidea]|uniref:Uncharacterized protein n=1 Tax=Coemansia helicoidea TaxID=1286919 RepID=A0ACC1KZY2_9FUNG|nr:hypothetical protein H4R21_003862 [Coemansia helicoidea]